MFQVEDAEPIGLAAILEGRVLLLRHVNDATPTLVHVGGPGFWFGEGAVLDGVTLVTAVAQSATRLLILAKPEFDRIVTDEPRYYPAFAAIVLARYRVLLRFYAEARGTLRRRSPAAPPRRSGRDAATGWHDRGARP